MKKIILIVGLLSMIILSGCNKTIGTDVPQLNHLDIENYKNSLTSSTTISASDVVSNTGIYLLIEDGITTTFINFSQHKTLERFTGYGKLEAYGCEEIYIMDIK